MERITALHVDITNSCNLKCAYCFVMNRREHAGHIDTEKVVALI